MNVTEIPSTINIADNPGAFEPVAQMRRLGNLQPAILLLYKTLGPNDLVPVQFQFERRRTDLLAAIPDKSGVSPSSKATSPDHLIEETTDNTDRESIDGKAINDILQTKKAGKNQRKADLQGRKRANHSRAERDPSHQYLKEQNKYSNERPAVRQANSSPQQHYEHERIVSRLSDMSLASGQSSEHFRGRHMRAAPRSRATSAGSSRPQSRSQQIIGRSSNLSIEGQRKTEELYNRLFAERLEQQDRIFEKLQAKAAETRSPRTSDRRQLRRERRHSDVSPAKK